MMHTRGSDTTHTFSLVSNGGSDQDASDLSSRIRALCGSFKSSSGPKRRVTAPTLPSEPAAGGKSDTPRRGSAPSTTGGGCQRCAGHRCHCAPPAIAAFKGCNPMHNKQRCKYYLHHKSTTSSGRENSIYHTNFADPSSSSIFSPFSGCDFFFRWKEECWRG